MTMVSDHFNNLVELADELMETVEDRLNDGADGFTALAMAFAMAGKLRGYTKEQVADAARKMYDMCHTMSDERS